MNYTKFYRVTFSIETIDRKDLWGIVGMIIMGADLRKSKGDFDDLKSYADIIDDGSDHHCDVYLLSEEERLKKVIKRIKKYYRWVSFDFHECNFY